LSDLKLHTTQVCIYVQWSAADKGLTQSGLNSELVLMVVIQILS